MRLTLLPVIAAAMLTGGCFAKYAQPEELAPHAVLQYDKPMKHNGVQLLFSVDNADCDNWVEVGGFSGWEAKTLTYRLQVGKPIYLLAQMTDAVSLRTQADCRNLISFVPEAGHTYRLRQSMWVRGCTVEVVDFSTNSVPPSFEFHDVHKKGC